MIKWFAGPCTLSIYYRCCCFKSSHQSERFYNLIWLGFLHIQYKVITEFSSKLPSSMTRKWISFDISPKLDGLRTSTRWLALTRPFSPRFQFLVAIASVVVIHGCNCLIVTFVFGLGNELNKCIKEPEIIPTLNLI